MKKFLNILLVIALIYFTAGGGCGGSKGIKAANAMPVEIYYFVVTSDITPHMRNLTPPSGAVMRADSFAFEFDMMIDQNNPDYPVPDIAILCTIGVVTETRTPLVIGGEEYHVRIEISGLSNGQRIGITVDDKLNVTP